MIYALVFSGRSGEPFPDGIETLCLGPGTRLFIIDPNGVDIIDKRVRAPGVIPQTVTPLMESLMNAVDGASRRDLNRTFSGDNIERGKIEHFMTRELRK